MQPHLLDDGLHGWLGVMQAQSAAVDPQAPGQNREIEHQRGVAEGQLGQVDDHVRAHLDGPGKGTAPVPLGGPILISSTTQDRGGVIEFDDPGNLHNRATGGNPSIRLSGAPAELS